MQGSRSAYVGGIKVPLFDTAGVKHLINYWISQKVD